MRNLRLLLAALVLTSCQVGAVERPDSSAGPPASVAASPSATARPIARPPAATERPARTPPPTPSPTPVPTPIPPRVAFGMNLYSDGDFVAQHTFEWCVGASVQMAWNMVHPTTRSSYEDQEAIWQLARSHSTNSFNGANPIGWAQALTDIGVGDYEVVVIADYEEALRAAARAMRETNLPVGLVMWRGRHAWVMNGFESIGDPTVHADFEVTGIRVLDPLFPHGSASWGPSPPPNTLMSPEQLAEQFVVRTPRRWSIPFGAGYPLIVPTGAG